MTTAVVNERKVQMTITEKAHMLQVFDINEPGKLAVTSGSQANVAYVVSHNGQRVTHCPCKAFGRCCHMVAGDWHLEAERRAAYVEEFHIYG